jgi:hypothetical protein
MNRFKKNIKIDGRPIEDTERGYILNKDDIVVILNNYEARIVELEAAITELQQPGENI